MASVWCVQHRDGWCATYGGRRPDPKALNDRTRCGHFVIARVGSERREPDCIECRVKMGIHEANTLAGWTENINLHGKADHE